MPRSTVLQAGKLRHRITLLTVNQTQDTFGGWQIGDASIFAENVPASVETYNGREMYAAQQKVADVTHLITMRWQIGIRSDMAVKWHDGELERFFQVQNVENPDGRRHVLVLHCVERNDSERGV